MKLLACCAVALVLPAAGRAQNATPPTARGPEYVAVMSAFPPELDAIEAKMVTGSAKLQTTRLNGIEFKTAQIGGRCFVFFLTGKSLVNAAMNTQLALDHFNITAVFFTGIAGGIDPDLHPGDVVIPARWHYHAESVYINETAPGQFALPGFFKQKYLNFGMIFPDNATVKREGMDKEEQVSAFPADEKLLSAARRATDAMPPLAIGDHASKVTYGGDGVSGTVFCDNAAYRQWVFQVWKAQCVDMESAAIAHVCWANKTPCLIVRGLSDLAGGQAGTNEVNEYLKAAADHSAQVLVRILQNLDAPVPAAVPSPGH